MIRPVTCVCLLMAAGSGLYLYQAKHQAHVLDRDITRTMIEVSRLRQRINVLRADYQLEQDPQTLGELTRQYLEDLKPTSPSQFTTWAELQKVLPPVPPPPAPEATAPAPASGAGTPEAVPVVRAEPPRQAVPAPSPHVETAHVEPPPAHPAAMRPTVPPVAAIAMAPLVTPAPPPAAAASRQIGRSVLSGTRQEPATTASALAFAGAATARVPLPVSLAPVSIAPSAAVMRPQPPVPFANRPSVNIPAAAYVPRSYVRSAPAATPMPLVASALGMARVMLAPVAAAPADAATARPARYPAGNMQ
jgi:hypothetical protein